MRILEVSTLDIAGGAESVARELTVGLKRLGHRASLAVGHKRVAESDTLAIPIARDYRPRNPAAPPPRSVEAIVQDLNAGLEDFSFPGSWDLLELATERPDLVHCHNLHGGYFDLNVLPWLSRQLPVALTLHDAWLLAGHCAHSFGCERWRSGCGDCPDLSIYPPLQRDGTAENWRRKQNIYQHSRVYVSAPSQWLLDLALASMLCPAVVDACVIPNGIDTAVFCQRSKQEARSLLNIPQDLTVLLFAANGIRNNVWKDYESMRAVLGQLGQRMPGHRLVLIGIGESGPPEQIGSSQIFFVPYQVNPANLALFYQAADLYLHMARAETFGIVIAEALGCGTPVAANAVGGIPELVRSLAPVRGTTLARHDETTATGVLAGPGPNMVDDMAAGIQSLFENPERLQRLGANAAADARQRFDMRDVVRKYADWFQFILKRENGAL